MSSPSRNSRSNRKKTRDLGRVLDQVKRRPAIGQHPAEFTIKVGILRRQPSNGLGDAGILLGPVVASAGKDFHSAGVESGVHPISIEYLISCSQSGPSGALVTSAASCGLTHVGRDAGSALRRVEVGVARSDLAILTMYQEFPTTGRELRPPDTVIYRPRTTERKHLQCPK